MEWKDIATAPKDGTRILVYRKLEDGYEYQRIGLDRWKNNCWRNSRTAMPPTHWMPLPAPPSLPPNEGV